MYDFVGSSRGSEFIALERDRQKEQEGFDAKHDDQYVECQLIGAAISYARWAAGSDRVDVEDTWPDDWSDKWHPAVKKHSEIESLVKAGALIAAEIDRRLRKESLCRETMSS